MLEQLEQQLKEQKKFWMYASRIQENMTEDEKIALAQKVLETPKSWAENLKN